jgi:hypothetical protein
MIAVSDTGTGIPQAIRKKVFEPRPDDPSGACYGRRNRHPDIASAQAS